MLSAYDLDVNQIEPLETSSFNLHFSLEASEGRFNLRRSNRPTAPANLLYEASLLAHLERQGFKLSPKVILTRTKSNPRAKDPKELQHLFKDYSEKMAQTADTLDAALQLAARAVSREDLIVVTGSFYLVGEAKKYLANLADKRAREAAKN